MRAGEDYSDPEFTWQQTIGPTGLDFLNSSALGAQYQNDLFVGDYNNGNLYHFDLNENRTQLVLEGGLADRALDPGDEVENILFGTGFGGITDVKVGPDGYLYVLTFQDDGSIFRIVPEGVVADETDGTDGEDSGATAAATTDETDGTDGEDSGAHGGVATTDETDGTDGEDSGATAVVATTDDDLGTRSLNQILAERITRDILD